MSESEDEKIGVEQGSPLEASLKKEEGEGSKVVIESMTDPVRRLVVAKTPKAQEIIPTQDEVFAVMEQFVKGKEKKIRKKFRDEKGLYLWEIVVPGEDGETIEYSYARKGRYPETQARITVINRAFFDRDGVPVGGDSVAKFVDGKWKVTP